MKNKVLKQCSTLTNPKTWHMPSLASFTYSEMDWMSSRIVDINNHMCLKWLQSLPSFFKISIELWTMVVLKKSLQLKLQLIQWSSHQQFSNFLWHTIEKNNDLQVKRDDASNAKFCQYSYNFKQKCVFWLCGIKPFHEPSLFPFQSTNPPFHPHSIPNMHFVVSFDNILVNISSSR
jgi:hypothetical protein